MAPGSVEEGLERVWRPSAFILLRSASDPPGRVVRVWVRGVLERTRPPTSAGAGWLRTLKDAWDRLAEDEKDRALLSAFPDGRDYSRDADPEED